MSTGLICIPTLLTYLIRAYSVVPYPQKLIKPFTAIIPHPEMSDNIFRTLIMPLLIPFHRINMVCC
jgi:hypothetical protein